MASNNFIILLPMILCISTVLSGTTNCYANTPEIELLQKYIRMNTTSGVTDLEPAVELWRQLAEEVGLEFTVHRPAGLPIPVITWVGTEPDLPAIMLNSHIDVVPAIPSEWTYPPFSAHIDENCDLYGRGTQDTKGVSLLYWEAIHRMKRDNVRLRRTLHVTLMPDEEIGSDHGAKVFLNTEEFRNLNIGFALDEGLAAPNDFYLAFYRDKRPWQIKFTFHGEAGHGASIPSDTAAEKVRVMMNLISDFRAEQATVAGSLDPLDYGGYTTINTNLIQGGYAVNVIPGEMSITVDIRLASNVNITEFQTKIDGWVSQTGANTTLEFVRREDISTATPVDDSNSYWVTLQDFATEIGSKVVSVEVPATTDMLYVRALGIPALGFSPLIKTQTRLHGVNEYLNTVIYVQSIDVYIKLLQKLANMGLRMADLIGTVAADLIKNPET